MLETLDNSEAALEQLKDSLADAVEQERAALCSARDNLQNATGASASVWEQAKRGAQLAGKYGAHM